MKGAVALGCVLGAVVLVVACVRGPARSAPVVPPSAASGNAEPTASVTATGVAAIFPPDPAFGDAHPAPYSWAAKPGMIAHGMGGVDGRRVTNSLEAFRHSYDAGYRIFEVDLVFTSDGALVARHDWEPYMYGFLGQTVADPARKLTKAEFQAMRIHGSMTPLTVEDVVGLMRSHPDMWVMTDTKSKDPAEVRAAMRAILDAMGPDQVLAERVIVQIYDEPMLAQVRSAHEFKNIVYTLYQLEGTRDAAVRFAARNGIRVVAMPEAMWTPAFAGSITAQGMVPAVYTTNDPAVARKYRASGVGLLYSDFLPATP